MRARSWVILGQMPESVRKYSPTSTERRQSAACDGVVLSAPFAVEARFLSPQETAALHDEWTALAADSIEANPFFSPSMLAPALSAFADKTVRIAIVRDERGRLILLLPVVRQFGYSRLPVSYLATWLHPHCFYGAPLIRRGKEEEALAAFFDLVEREGTFFRFCHLDEEGAAFKAALRAAKDRRVAPSARYRRALLRGGFETGAHLREVLSGKKRKELRRLRARLDGEGSVVFETLKDAGALADWTADFLALEAAGWKGRAGTALANDPAASRFFTEALKSAFDRGGLLFHRLRVGARPIAMIVNFIEGAAAYSFKIAHDEEFARYSPGVMLEIEMMRALEELPGLSFVDSCAASDHSMINALWRERRTIAALNVSSSAGAQILFRVLTGLEKAGDAMRRRRATPDDEGSHDDLR